MSKDTIQIKTNDIAQIKTPELIVAKETLGVITIKEVFDYYDGPILFTCESLSGQVYLAMWVEAQKSADRWFYLPISIARLSSVKQGIISLHDAFSKPEDNWLWEIKKSHNHGSDEINRIFADQIAKEDLPCEDSFLKLQSNRLPEKKDSVLIEAERTKRDVLDISINNGNSTEIGAEALGLTLLTFQELIQAIAYPGMGLRGKIPSQIKEKNSLMVTGVFASSFGVRLESKHSDLYNSSIPAIERFMSLLQAKANFGELLSILKNTNLRTNVRYRSFLKAIKNNNLSITAEWASPNLKNYKHHLTLSDTKSILALFEKEGQLFSEIRTLEGDLTGIYLDKGTFWFHSSDGIHYTGKLSENLRSLEYKIPARVEVELEETIEINELSHQEESHYKLLTIKELTDINIK